MAHQHHHLHHQHGTNGTPTQRIMVPRKEDSPSMTTTTNTTNMASSPDSLHPHHPTGDESLLLSSSTPATATTATSSSLTLAITPPSSSVANQAWAQRQLRRQKKQLGTTKRSHKRRRVIVGMVATLMGFVLLLVVHVEVTMLDQATSTRTTSAQVSAAKLGLQPNKNNNNGKLLGQQQQQQHQQLRRRVQIEEKEEEKEEPNHEMGFEKHVKLTRRSDPFVTDRQQLSLLLDQQQQQQQHNPDPSIIKVATAITKHAATAAARTKTTTDQQQHHDNNPSSNSNNGKKTTREFKVVHHDSKKFKNRQAAELALQQENARILEQQQKQQGKLPSQPPNPTSHIQPIEKDPPTKVVATNLKGKDRAVTTMSNHTSGIIIQKQEQIQSSITSDNQTVQQVASSSPPLGVVVVMDSDKKNETKRNFKLTKDQPVHDVTDAKAPDNDKEQKGAMTKEPPKIASDPNRRTETQQPKQQPDANSITTDTHKSVAIPERRIIEQDDNGPLAVALAKAMEKVAQAPPSRTVNFCTDNLPRKESTEPVAPAVILMGMEDTSTDLLWHVLGRIAPEGSILVADSQNQQQQPHVPMYEKLNQLDPTVEERFWAALPPESHGHWIQTSLCSQQQQKASAAKWHPKEVSNLLGFPWLTLAWSTRDNKAMDTLKLMSTWLPGSVKVIRYRRNLLDMVTRIEAHLIEMKEHQPRSLHTFGVNLDKHKILQQLTQWRKKEETIDKFLQDSQIPHIVIDHETIFPFNDWKELVNVTSLAESSPLPLNVKIDYSRVPPDQRPPEPSAMEKEWTKLLEFLNLVTPMALADVFHAADSYDRKDAVFWTQQLALTNYATVQQELMGTHFQSLLRNPVYKHDYFGCACNDKEANKKRLLRGWKNVKIGDSTTAKITTK